MTDTCHECQTIVEKLNLEYDELYLKYKILKNQRYNEIIKNLFFRINVIQYQNDWDISSDFLEDIDKYCQLDEIVEENELSINYQFCFNKFNIIEFFLIAV